MNKLMMAVLGGMAAGFVIGVLVAPEKGAELRKKISDAAGNWAEKLVDIFAGSSENLSDAVRGNISVSSDEILG